MPTEPREAALDDPIEPGDPERLLAPLDDHKPPAVPVKQVLCETFALIAGVRDDGVNIRSELRQPDRQSARRPAIGHTCRLDPAGDEKPLRINEYLALSSLHPLVTVEAANAPLSVVLTDWASMITTVGSARRPAFRRAARWRTRCIRVQTPSRRQRRKYHQTVPQGGKSDGSMRHWQPVRSR
jgi:hypothetical protein